MALTSTYKLKEKYRISISLVLGIIYAVSDELHQMFSPGRSAKISDVYIDTVGILLGMTALLLILKIYQEIKNKRQKLT